MKRVKIKLELVTNLPQTKICKILEWKVFLQSIVLAVASDQKTMKQPPKERCKPQMKKKPKNKKQQMPC